MSTTNGLAIYGLPNIDLNKALEIAMDFFASIGVKPTEINYTIPLKDDPDEEDIGLKKISIQGLSKAIRNGVAKDFSIDCCPPKSKNWICSFLYETTAFMKGEFGKNSNHISITYSNDLLDIKNSGDMFSRMASQLAAITKIPYGILYQAKSAPMAASYASGGEFYAILKNENANCWQSQMPLFLRDGIADYFHKLRMVYPCNLITDHHLNLHIDGGSLQSWIEADATRGHLSRVGDVAIWKIETQNLEAINDACGHAGILLCWEEKKAKSVIRKLP